VHTPARAKVIFLRKFLLDGEVLEGGSG